MNPVWGVEDERVSYLRLPNDLMTQARLKLRSVRLAALVSSAMLQQLPFATEGKLCVMPLLK